MQSVTQIPITQKIETPNDIHIPEYLEEYLSDVDLPNRVNMGFLLNLGVDILDAKKIDVTSSNMSSNSARRQIPDKLGFDEVAIILMSLFIFKNIQMTERAEDTILSVYVNDKDSPKNGIYNTNTRYMYEIMERLAPKFKRKDMDDVIDKITRAVESVEQTQDKNLFAVENGIFNQKTGKLMNFDPEYVYLTKIPINYNPKAKNKVLTAPDGYKWDVENWINDLTDYDADTTTLIWQVIADCMQPSHSRYKSIWFYSEKGNNGKGSIGQLIKNLLGRGNYASLSVVDFNHEFLKEKLLGTAANISDENDVDIYIDSIKDYKASITGDDINVNIKHKQPLTLKYFGTNIQMMNGLPKTKDKSDSFYRRIILVPFLKSFTNNGERQYIKDSYIHDKDVLEYVLLKALNMEFDEYITPKASAELLESYKEKNNPVLEFWNELKDEFVWDILPTQFLYDLFAKWSDINNPSGKLMSKRTFSDTLSNVILTLEEPWEVKTSQNDKIRTGNKMKDDEPLITEFGLDTPNKAGSPSSWMNHNYSGDKNQEKRRDFERKDTYRGYERIL